MADIYDRAVMATVGISIDQKVTATLRPHMAQSHGVELSNFGRGHASQSSGADPQQDRAQNLCRGVLRCSKTRPQAGITAGLGVR
jgi:hypothetical protein